MIYANRGLTPDMAAEVPLKICMYLIVSAALGLMASCRFETKYTLGGSVTGLRGSGLVIEDNAGNASTVTANGTFVFSTTVANGHAYSVTVSTQPSDPDQTCTVRNGSGTVDRADVSNIFVSCTQAGQFAYVANEISNDVSAYAIDSATGQLSAIAGSPFASNGTAPTALAVDPNGTYLYAANSGSNDVVVFGIGVTGALTSAGLAIPVGRGPAALAIDPTDHYLYVANEADNTVSAFTLANGLATAVTGSPYGVGSEPISLKIDPAGNFLYVANFGDGTVTVLAIDSTTGALTAIAGSPFGAGAGAVSIAIDPTGALAYVANETNASISLYTIDSSTGALSTVSGSPLATGSKPESLAADPTGRFIYAANVTSQNDIALYAITPTSGALTLSTTAAAGTFPLSVVVDPSGQFVYAANDDSADISVYSVNAGTGELTAVTGSPFAAGSGPRSIAID